MRHLAQFNGQEGAVTGAAQGQGSRRAGAPFVAFRSPRSCARRSAKPRSEVALMVKITSTLQNVHYLFSSNNAHHAKGPGLRRESLGLPGDRHTRMRCASQIKCSTRSIQCQPPNRCPAPGVRAPDPKARGAWRELDPRGCSDRSNGSCGLRENHGPSRPRAGLQAGRPNMTPYWLAASQPGRRLAPVIGQGGYTKLESMPSYPRPDRCKAGGEGSGSGSYGATP